MDSWNHSSAYPRTLVPYFAGHVQAYLVPIRSRLIFLLGVLLKAVWIPDIGCTIIKSNTTVLAATFIYSMSFDLVVLCLTAYKLAWTRRISGTTGIHSKLIRMVFSDGLVYFILAYVIHVLPDLFGIYAWSRFLANLLATIFMIMNLNAIMSVIFNVPAAIASTVRLP